MRTFILNGNSHLIKIRKNHFHHLHEWHKRQPVSDFEIIIFWHTENPFILFAFSAANNIADIIFDLWFGTVWLYLVLSTDHLKERGHLRF